MLKTSPSEQVTSASGSLASAHLSDWLAQHQLSLVMTTYQSTELLLAHPTSEGLSIARHAFDRPMGLYATPGRSGSLRLSPNSLPKLAAI